MDDEEAVLIGATREDGKEVESPAASHGSKWTKYKNLAVNIALFALNSVATKLITFLLVPLYTAYMNEVDFGISDMSATVINLALPLATLQIAEAILRFSIDDTDHQQKYITWGFIITILSCVLVGCASPLLNASIFGGLGKYAVFFTVAYSVAAIQQFCGYIARGVNQIKLIPWSSVAVSFSTAILAWYLIGAQGMGLIGYYWSIILGGSFGIFVYMIGGRQYRFIHFKVLRNSSGYLKKMLVYSVPLMPNALSWWIGVNINRFFIVSMLGIATSGIFAAAWKIPNIVNMLSQIFMSAWNLSAFQEFKNNNIANFYSIIFKVYHAIAAVLTSSIIMLAPWIASFMLQGNFYSGWVLIPIMVIAVFYSIMSSFFASLYTASMKTMFLFITTIVGAVAVVIATPIFIHWLGLQGAGVAMLIGNGIILILRMIDSRRIMRFPISWLTLIPTQVLLLGQGIIRAMDLSFSSVLGCVLFAAIIICQAIEVLPALKSLITVAKRK